MIKVNPKIFKSYDIRGIYPNELNDQTAYLVGRAFAKKVKVKEIIVGSDMRISSPALKKQVIKGIIDEGIDVIDIGLVSIDAVYYAVYKLEYPAGIMITASHNPKEYNGFKMPTSGIIWVRGEELLEEVLNLPDEIGDKKGQVREIDILPEFINHVLSFCEVEKIKPLRVVVDAGNGMAGKIIPLLQKYLPIEIIPLNFELNGNFPAHPSNPLMPESQIQIKEAVLKEKADFGAIFDGDADRLFFVDENGNFIRADYTLLILAKKFLSREPGKGIVHNVICSKIVPEKILEWGGRPLKSKVGFVNISAKMRENDGIMGGELSAHYSFRDNGYADSGFIAWLILMQLISEDGRKLSQIAAEFQKYFKSDEINLEIEDRVGIITKIKEQYKNGKQEELDGLTVEYNDWWFNVRPSNTEPLLRVVIEADSQNLAEEKSKELVDFINQVK